MTVKELKELYDKLNDRMLALETAILNHTGVHKLDRIIQATGVILMLIVVFLLKFKVL